MSNQFICLFTFKTRDEILSAGGSGDWRLGLAHAKRCTHAVLIRNKLDVRGQPSTEEHCEAFFVGRIRDVVEVESGRYLLVFSEYASVSIPNYWHGNRNPVDYRYVKDSGIDFSGLDWQPMPAQADLVKPREIVAPSKQAFTIADAKRELSRSLGVRMDQIEITIKA